MATKPMVSTASRNSTTMNSAVTDDARDRMNKLLNSAVNAANKHTSTMKAVSKPVASKGCSSCG